MLQALHKSDMPIKYVALSVNTLNSMLVEDVGELASSVTYFATEWGRVNVRLDEKVPDGEFNILVDDEED
jgi:hypothetical protein